MYIHYPVSINLVSGDEVNTSVTTLLHHLIYKCSLISAPPEQSSVKREGKRFYFSVAFKEPESGNSYFSAMVKADM